MSVLDSGQRVGRYRIVRFLGAGAMGEVYLAEDPHIERRLAIKTVRLAGGRPADIEDRKRRLLREARAAGRLLHPNVVALFDAGEEEGLLYLAFEFVEGCDLASRLESGPPPSLREVLRIVRQVADALDYAHRQGIVHRDIKPSNILIDAAGHVKVADFGIAKVTGQNTELTVAGSVMGSPQYLSPEQIRGDELDGRSDIFSLGVVLYELLSGRRPFDGETITTLVYQILHKDVSISELRSVPLRLDQLLHHMLAKDREERLATAGLVAEELAAIERELPEQVLSAPAAPASDMLDATRVMPSRSLTPPPARSTPPAGVAVSGSGQQAMPPLAATPGAAGALGAPGSQTLTPTTATAPPTSGVAGASGSSGAYGIPAAHGTSSAIGSGAVPTAAGVFAPPPPVPVAVPPSAPFAAGIPPAAPPGAQAQQPSYPTYPQGPPPAATATARSSNGKIWLLLGGLLLVFFAVVAAGGYWVWTRYLHAASDGGQAAAGVPSGTAPDSGTANPSHLADGSIGANGANGASGTNGASGASGSGVTGGSSSTSQVGQSGGAGQPGTQTAGDSASAAARANANPGNSANGATGPFGQPTNSAGPFGSGGPNPGGPSGSAGSGNPGGTGAAPSTGQPYPPTTPSGRPGSPGTTRQAGPGAPYTPPGRPPVYVPTPPQPPAPGIPGTGGANGSTAAPGGEESAGSANAGRSARGRRPVETAPSGDGDESAEVGDVTVTPTGPAADRVLRSGLELAFRVNPPDAYVLLDGGVIGRAEEWNGQKGARSYTLPSTGTHIIKIKKPGMKEYRIAVEASATRGVTPIFVNLQALPSAQVEVTDLETIHVREAIALHVQPDVAAVVLVDGSTAGPAKKFGGRFGHGDEWLSLPIGMHRVTLIAPSFKRKDLAVDVSPGADKARQKIDVSLVPETGH